MNQKQPVRASTRKHPFLRPLLVLAGLILAAGGAGAVRAQVIQNIAITQTGPVACPTAGCAPGQTINVNTNYDLSADRVLVCVFASTSLNAADLRFGAAGTLSGAAYTAAGTPADCGSENNAVLAGAVQADVSGYSGDSLPFSLRLGANATGSGSITVRTLGSDTGSAPWTQMDQFFLPLTVAPAATTVFVANDAAACGSNSPCYLNSNEDLPNGVGTGLKDAIDAAASGATLNVMGNYTIKSNPVAVNKAITLQGWLDGTITYTGSACSNAMLAISDGATLRSLNINGGSCTTTRRELLTINSASAVRVESNDLTGGANAIHITGGSGAVSVRFNQISGNSGYAVIRENSGTGLLNLTANNLYDNRSGAQVECNLLTSGANHNFWGYGVSPASAALQCSPTTAPLADSKRLGAAILLNPTTPGVQAQEVTVTTAKTYAFNNAIAYQHSAGADFPIILVNHGQGSPENVPFTGGMPNSLTACSNYYDVFTANGSATPTDLSLFLRYDLTSGCTSFVESASVCGANDPALVPLWWYDPAGLLTDGWDTTGQNPTGSGAPAGSIGQLTTCEVSSKELKVALNNNTNQRPNLAADMNYTPLVVGYRPEPVSIVFTAFSATPGNTQASIRWTTASEEAITGFYVVRSITETGGYERASILFPRRGSDTSGFSYEFVDSMLTNGTRYYYRIEIITTGGLSSYTAATSVVPLTATTTPTVTVTQTPTTTSTTTQTPVLVNSLTPTPTSTLTQSLTPTITHTPTITNTPTVTLTRTRTLTPYPTRTRTRTSVVYPTSVYRSPTPYPSRTFFPTRTSTRGTPGTQTTSGGSNAYPSGNETLTGTRSPSAGLTDDQNGYPPGSLDTTPGITTLEGTAAGTSGGEDNAYPGESVEQTPQGTGTGEATQPTELTGTPGIIPTPGAPVTWVKTYWPYLLALLLLELALVGGYGFYLYRKGLLTFPLIRSKADSAAESESEPPSDPEQM